MQDEFDATYNALKRYAPKKEKYISDRESLLINAKTFYEGRQMIIDAFKNKIFPMVPTGFDEDEEPLKG